MWAQVQVSPRIGNIAVPLPLVNTNGRSAPPWLTLTVTTAFSSECTCGTIVPQGVGCSLPHGDGSALATITTSAPRRASSR